MRALLINLAVGERLQHYAVHDREHDGGRIQGFAPDGAQRVAKIEQNGVYGGLDGEVATEVVWARPIAWPAMNA